MRPLEFVGVLTVSMSVFLVMGVVTPVLPQYVRLELGGGSVAVGFVMGGFAIVALVFRPLAGSVSDRFGPGPAAGAGALVACLSGLAYFIPGYTGVALARASFGMGEAMMTSAAMSWAVALAPPQRRGQMLAWFGLSIWAGLTIGPQIGVALLDHGGYPAVWTFIALSPLVGGAVALSLRSGRRPLAERAEFPSLRQLVPRTVIRPGLAMLLGAVGEGVLTAFVILQLADRGLGGSNPGAAGARVYTIFGLAVVVLRLLGGRITDSLGGSAAARISSGFEGLGLLLIGLAPSMAVVLTGAVTTGAGFAVLFPALALLAVNRSDERRRGATIAAFTAFYDIGFAAGGTIGGIVASFAGYRGAFFYAAAAALAINAMLGPPARRRIAP